MFIYFPCTSFAPHLYLARRAVRFEFSLLEFAMGSREAKEQLRMRDIYSRFRSQTRIGVWDVPRLCFLPYFTWLLHTHTHTHPIPAQPSPAQPSFPSLNCCNLLRYGWSHRIIPRPNRGQVSQRCLRFSHHPPHHHSSTLSSPPSARRKFELALLWQFSVNSAG
jgi:hypothetical protein